MVDGPQNKKIAFIVQARMGSTRLPGKILMPLPLETDRCLLNWIIDNLKESSFNNTIFIATSLNSKNDPLEGFCKKNSVTCYRGCEEDVLSRFMEITKTSEFDHVVRLTGDNPFIDIDLLDKSISHHLESGADYTATAGLPLGMNFEIICAKALQGLDEKELSTSEREHVTLHFKNTEGYKLGTFYPLKEDLSNLRLTVDYSSDYLLVSTILSIAEKRKILPGLDLIKYCLEEYPWIFTVNQNNIQKNNYKSIQEEIEVAKPILSEYGFNRLISVIDENE